jgi:DNA-binding protein H-NS
MKDIHEVLRRKQAKYAQLAKQIEALQQAAEKLREVAPLLAENEEDDNVVLAEMDDDAGQSQAMAAKASASPASGAAPAKTGRGVAPRWP